MEATLDNVLNVTLLEPRYKHSTIFERYDALNEGEQITIHNDHDPKPLYYQLLGERGNVFTWEYLEEGPVWWKVRIRKRISGENEGTLGELAAEDLRKAAIFKRYGLDFSCGGKKTVKEACAEKGLDVTLLEQELQQVDKSPSSRSIPYDEWDLGFLADFIVNTHHRYIRKNLPDITTYSNKVMEVHSSRHPELKAINDLVIEVGQLLTRHIRKEEDVLFPYIKEMESTAKIAASPQLLGSLKQNLDALELEHRLLTNKMGNIRSFANNYTLPSDSCASYTLLYRHLEELEEDLQEHFHLENNILFAKSTKLEKNLSKR
ncbi:MAG TPA: DUF542 domain-containing protein [Arenibacter sp.]|nr:DUF542 domain-containing protein [Arenibacter sp.]